MARSTTIFLQMKLFLFVFLPWPKIAIPYLGTFNFGQVFLLQKLFLRIIYYLFIELITFPNIQKNFLLLAMLETYPLVPECKPDKAMSVCCSRCLKFLVCYYLIFDLHVLAFEKDI